MRSIGGRKFGLSMLIFLVTVALLIIDKIKEADYIVIASIVISSYIGGIVAQFFLVNKDGQLTADQMFDALGGRTFGLIVTVYLGTAILLWLGFVEAPVYIDIIKLIAYSYMAGNIADKISINGLPFSVTKK